MLEYDGMKKQILFFVTVVFLFCNIFSFLVSANPLPVPDKVFSPMTDNYNGSIEFFSEEVTYTIDNGDDAKVDAYYVFKNTKNQTVIQNMILPFVEIPIDLEIRKNGRKISYEEVDYDLRVNNSVVVAVDNRVRITCICCKPVITPVKFVLCITPGYRMGSSDISPDISFIRDGNAAITEVSGKPVFDITVVLASCSPRSFSREPGAEK